MEVNCSQGGIVHGENSYGDLNFQGYTRDLHPNGMNQNQSQKKRQTCVHNSLVTEYNNGEREKNKNSEDSLWQRVKWMDKMVKLMITALSYIGEDSGLDDKYKKKIAVLQKKGKWKLVSKVMDERGYHVSPQQCEDKFNDLNKRYKKLNDMLGRGTCCDVVENHALLDKIDYLNEKEKEQVRKIISSKHLFYKEMCSYHNGNRLHLPHDSALQRSLHLKLITSDDHDNDHNDDGDKDCDECEEHVLSHRDCRGINHGVLGGPFKRLRQSQRHEDVVGQSCRVNSRECNKDYVSRLSLSQAVVNREVSRDRGSLQKQWIKSKSFELEEHKLQIQTELMKLERQRLKWERFGKKRGQKIEKMRIENERMKLENERMKLELKRLN